MHIICIYIYMHTCQNPAFRKHRLIRNLGMMLPTQRCSRAAPDGIETAKKWRNAPIGNTMENNWEIPWNTWKIPGNTCSIHRNHWHTMYLLASTSMSSRNTCEWTFLRRSEWTSPAAAWRQQTCMQCLGMETRHHRGFNFSIVTSGDMNGGSSWLIYQ